MRLGKRETEETEITASSITQCRRADWADRDREQTFQKVLKTETINQSATYFPDPVLEMIAHLKMEFFRNIEKSPFYEKANKSIKQPGKAAPHHGYLSYASHLT